MFKSIKLIIILFTIPFSLFAINSLFANANEVDSSKIVFKIKLKSGEIYNGSIDNKQIYVITEFARLSVSLWEIDSVEIGILPDFYREKKIVNMLDKLSSGNIESRRKIYNKIISLNIGALPIIRNYIDNQPPKVTVKPYNSEILTDIRTPENALQDLMHKYRIDRDFVDKDVLYMHQNYKIGGIITTKKKRAQIRFNNYIFPREDIMKIIILHKKERVQ